jgi:hypothetical protein
MAELVDAADLKSAGYFYIRAGSTPAPGIRKKTAKIILRIDRKKRIKYN